MKSTFVFWTIAIIFVCTLGMGSAYATSASTANYHKSVKVTGCLQQGPVAKEYLIQGNDGTTWGINETSDMLINQFVGQTVTVAGVAMHPTAHERTDGGAQKYMKAMDIAQDAEHCRQ